MRLGFAKITSCPHCGGEKEIMSLMSGNYIGAELWSDGKLIAPMLQKPSPVQKCPHCRKGCKNVQRYFQAFVPNI